MTGYDAVLTEVNGAYDISLAENGDILTRDSFETALLMSLWGERRAAASEMPVPELRRGWIGNESTPGWENGSKLWLYEQSRATRTVLNGIETAVANGLQWLVDDGLAIRVTVSARLTSGNISVLAEIERPNSTVERRYFDLWENT